MQHALRRSDPIISFVPSIFFLCITINRLIAISVRWTYWGFLYLGGLAVTQGICAEHSGSMAVG